MHTHNGSWKSTPSWDIDSVKVMMRIILWGMGNWADLTKVTKLGAALSLYPSHAHALLSKNAFTSAPFRHPTLAAYYAVILLWPKYLVVILPPSTPSSTHLSYSSIPRLWLSQYKFYNNYNYYYDQSTTTTTTMTKVPRRDPTLVYAFIYSSSSSSLLSILCSDRPSFESPTTTSGSIQLSQKTEKRSRRE